MAAAYIGVGSNIEPERNIPAALENLLTSGVSVVDSSRFYRTEAIGRPDQANYVNGVWEVRTELSPRELKRLLKEIEHRLGRVRSSDKFASREIDLDILLFDDLQLSEEGLRLPDPHIIERPFLARCLSELDPELKLPGTGRIVAEAAHGAEHLEEDKVTTESIKVALEKKR